MKKFFLFKTFVFILAGFFFSCSDGTVPSPEMQKITESESGNTAVLSAPKNLTASQGGKREINLTWDSVSKASLYYIYAADSLFSEYKLVGETLKNSFSYSPLGAGITKYIRVCSADYAGNLSSKTEPVSGTTLAQPVISDITEVTGEEDSSLVVWWYMENADFYKDELEYTIICKNSEGKEVANSNVYASELENTSFKLTDLKPSETYVYTVTAFLSTNPSATETSLEVNAETARRLRPNPPEELTATQGTSTSQITLSFKLPQKVDVLVAAKTYEEKPLYFKIYRRINGSENWTTLVSHLYYDGSETEPASFDSYTAGTEISWTDTTNLQRGVQYEYKVQSYADNISRVITSDLSSVTASGFLAAVPAFRADVNLITDADEESGTKATKYVSASVSFEGNWETFGTEGNWKFVLTTTYSGTLDGLSSASGSSETFDSLSELNAFSKSITLSDGTDGNEATEGYYKFALTIVSAEDSSNELLTTEAADTFFLTSLLTQPNLDSFSVTDGYSSKNILSWTFDDSCTYTLERKTLDSNGSAAETTTSSVTSSGTAGETFSYTDSAESGKIYSYTLYAIKEGRVFPSKAVTARTLGRPVPVFDENALSYDSITVFWPEVQKAESYEISLFDGTTQLGETEILDSEKIAEISAAGTVTYRISNPSGYNDAAISGKALSLKVTAENSVDSAGTAGTTQVRTMGPACTGLDASKATDSEKITVTWNETNGASGYILQRVRYNIPKEGNEEAQKTDVFYVGADKSVIYGEDSISETAISVTVNGGTFVVEDKQNENLTTNTGFETSQALISSGLPFEYTVIPVLSSDDVSEVGSFRIQYQNTQSLSKRGSTHGYGHNVTATKAASPNKIVISWNKPADPENLTPALFRRKLAASSSDSDESTWEQIGLTTLQETSTSYTDTLSVTEANIYEYTVRYGNTTPSFSKAYLNLLASSTSALGEADNKGYAFNLYYKADTGSEAEFAEKLEWTPFDSSYRKAAKVSGYEIYLKNTNYAKGWQKIATLDKNGIRTAGYDSGDYAFNTTFTYTEKNANLLNLKPTTATAKFGEVTGGGSYEGLLKVLRDPRHYYKIVMSGSYTEDGSSYNSITFDPSAEEINDDMTVYACRQITDAELIRSALCVMAYGFYIEEGGLPDLSNATSKLEYEGDKNIQTDNGGSAQFGSRSLISALLWDSEVGKYKADVTMTNYAPSQLTPSGIFSTWLKISMSNVSTRTAGLSDPYLDKFRTENFTVTVGTADTKIPVNYSTTLTMSCTGSDNLVVKMNNKTIINVSNSDTRKFYFPIQIDDSHCWLNSTTYGWWED